MEPKPEPRILKKKKKKKEKKKWLHSRANQSLTEPISVQVHKELDTPPLKKVFKLLTTVVSYGTGNTFFFHWINCFLSTQHPSIHPSIHWMDGWMDGWMVCYSAAGPLWLWKVCDSFTTWFYITTLPQKTSLRVQVSYIIMWRRLPYATKWLSIRHRK